MHVVTRWARRGLLALALAACQASPAATLRNADFEAKGRTLDLQGKVSGVVADGWDDNSAWGDVRVRYGLDRSPVAPRGRSQKIVVERGFVQFVQAVRLERGTTRASAWFRADRPTWVTLSLRQVGRPYQTYGSQVQRVGSDWAQITCSATLQSGADAYFMVSMSEPGSVWVDDASVSAGTTVQRARLSPPAQAIPQAFFGLNANHMHDKPGYAWPAVRFGAFRSWDSGVSWASIHTARGRYDWSKLDRDVQSAAARRQPYLFTFGITPRWASSRPEERSSYGPGNAAPPRDLGVWREFVSALASRYKGRIEAYELWNEPDLPGFFSGSAHELAEMSRVASAEIRRSDPSARIVAPGVSSISQGGGLRFLDEFLAAGGKAWVDVLAFHSYDAPPERMLESLPGLRTVIARHGLSAKPIWNTEGGQDVRGRRVDDTLGWLVRAHLVQWSLGVSRFYAYAYDNGHQLRMTAGPATRLDAIGLGYAQMQDWLVGARVSSVAPEPAGVWVATLQRPSGRAFVVWSESGGAFAVPKEWGVRESERIGGTRTPLAGGSVDLARGPVLLTAGRQTPRAAGGDQFQDATACT